VYRQVGNKNKLLLSKMKSMKSATWKIIGKGVDEFFMPKDAFVCTTCA
jgi:hypothetical protein